MKILLLTLLLIGLFGHSSSAETDPTIEKFLELPDADAFSVYIDAKKTEGRQTELMRTILAERKDSLIQFMFITDPPRNDLFAAISQLENLRLKTELVVLMLRSKSGFWPFDPDTDGSRGPKFDHLIEPFVGVIRDRLPGISIDESLFVSEASRMALATRLEKTLEENESTQEPAAGSSQAGGTSPETVPASKRSAAAEVSSKPQSPAAKQWWILPLAGTLAAAVLIAGLIQIRKKRR